MPLRNRIPRTLCQSLGICLREIADDEPTPEPAPPPIDFGPFIAAARNIGEWLLATARAHTDDPDDVSAIDRVAQSIAATFDGAPPCARGASEQDVLVVLGILITAFEIDFGVSGLGSLAGSLYDATDGEIHAITSKLAEALAAKTSAQIAAGQRGEVRAPGRRVATQPAPILVRRRPRVAYGVDEGDGQGRGAFVIVR